MLTKAISVVFVIYNVFNPHSAEMDTQYPSESHEELELPMYDLSTIIKATDDFSVNNKLGEGGFGPVYKVKYITLFLQLENKTLADYMFVKGSAGGTRNGCQTTIKNVRSRTK